MAQMPHRSMLPLDPMSLPMQCLVQMVSAPEAELCCAVPTLQEAVEAAIAEYEAQGVKTNGLRLLHAALSSSCARRQSGRQSFLSVRQVT